MSPDDDSKDYPVDKLTAISGSQYLPGTTNEGPDDFVLDGKQIHTGIQTGARQKDRILTSVGLV